MNFTSRQFFGLWVCKQNWEETVQSISTSVSCLERHRQIIPVSSIEDQPIFGHKHADDTFSLFASGSRSEWRRSRWRQQRRDAVTIDEAINQRHDGLDWRPAPARQLRDQLGRCHWPRGGEKTTGLSEKQDE